MFTDPQSLTKTGGSAISLPRVSSSDYSGRFRNDTGSLKLEISHAYGKRDRHVIRVVDTKVTADPLVAGSSFEASATVALTVDAPKTGYTVTELQAVIGALSTWLTASSGANPIKVLGGES